MAHKTHVLNDAARMLRRAAAELDRAAEAWERRKLSERGSPVHTLAVETQVNKVNAAYTQMDAAEARMRSYSGRR